LLKNITKRSAESTAVEPPVVKNGQLRRRRGSQAPGRIIGHGERLLGDGVGDLLAAVADIDAPHARRPVDQPVAVAVVDVDPLRAGHDRAVVVVQGLQVLPGVDDRVVELLQSVGLGEVS
jgi:hypothetical protein